MMEAGITASCFVSLNLSIFSFLFPSLLSICSLTVCNDHCLCPDCLIWMSLAHWLFGNGFKIVTSHNLCLFSFFSFLFFFLIKQSRRLFRLNLMLNTLINVNPLMFSHSRERFLSTTHRPPLAARVLQFPEPRSGLYFSFLYLAYKSLQNKFPKPKI